MKALKYNSYGGLEKMYWADVQLPEPTGKQLFVKIKAVSINSIDWKIRNEGVYSGKSVIIN